MAPLPKVHKAVLVVIDCEGNRLVLAEGEGQEDLGF